MRNIPAVEAGDKNKGKGCLGIAGVWKLKPAIRHNIETALGHSLLSALTSRRLRLGVEQH